MTTREKKYRKAEKAVRQQIRCYIVMDGYSEQDPVSKLRIKRKTYHAWICKTHPELITLPF